MQAPSFVLNSCEGRFCGIVLFQVQRPVSEAFIALLAGKRFQKDIGLSYRRITAWICANGYYVHLLSDWRR